jgi:hypothetical protein
MRGGKGTYSVIASCRNSTFGWNWISMVWDVVNTKNGNTCRKIWHIFIIWQMMWYRREQKEREERVQRVEERRKRREVGL